MTALRPQPDRPDPALAEDHESIATAFAYGGQWRQAYEHLRTALELHRADLRRADLRRAGLHQLDPEPQPDRKVHIPEQLAREIHRLRSAHARAILDSVRDALTESFNRRYLDQRLVAMLAEPGPGVTVAMVDLDHFKQVNDDYGHPLGDRVLRQVVQLLCVDLPTGAFCARYGGEEFTVVLPGTDQPAAVEICETARARIEHHPWHELAGGLAVTVSIGVTDRHPFDSTTGSAAEHQLLQADLLLYAAKRSGRNTVAYRADGRVHLAGAASARRGIHQVGPLRRTAQSTEL